MCCGHPNIAKGTIQPPSESKKGICRVCELVNNDHSEKNVIYCNTCKEWICDKHIPDILSRGYAAFLSLFKK